MGLKSGVFYGLLAGLVICRLKDGCTGVNCVNNIMFFSGIELFMTCLRTAYFYQRARVSELEFFDRIFG